MQSTNSRHEGGIPQALAYMLALMANGWEYPDAHAKAATWYYVDADDLAVAYDDRGPA